MLVVSQTFPIAAAFGVIAGYAPVALVRGRAQRRRRELAEVWPEAVDNLASAVRAGLSLPEALSQLGERGPEPLRPAFTAFGQDYLAIGSVRCLPGPAQGTARRSGRRPGGRGPADRA